MSDALDDFLSACSLHLAAQDGELAVAKKLLLDGFSINQFDEIGKTPLHYAAQYGHIEMMQFLLESGADVNAHDPAQAGNTPLGDVVQHCSYEVAKILIDAGADPLIPGWMQLTALDRVRERKRSEGQRVCQLLEESLRKKPAATGG